MDRRHFLRTAAIVAAGAIAADQLELLERLAPRRLFPAWPTPPRLWGDGIHDDTAALQALIHEACQRGTHIHLPPATYRITSTIYVPEATGKIIDGHGATLFSREATPILHLHQHGEAPERVHVANFHFEKLGPRAPFGVHVGGDRGILSTA